MKEERPVEVVCDVDEGLLRRGEFALTQELRSLLKNFTTQLDIYIQLPDRRVLAARFHKLNATFQSVNLGRWLRKEKVALGHRVQLSTLGPDVMNAFRVEVLEPAPVEPEVDPEMPAGVGQLDELSMNALAEYDQLASLEGPKAVAAEDVPEPTRFEDTHEVDTETWDDLVEKLAGDEVSGDAGAFGLRLLARDAQARSDFHTLWGLDHLHDVELYEHQLSAVQKVLQDFQGRGILADEVGLGKTIEAGMITSEYIRRGLVKKFLILSPASLVKQWQEEFRSKFDLDVQTHLDIEDWREHPYIVASLDTAKGVKHREVLRECGFDLVVVDEAHKLKNQRTRNWKFVRELETRYLLLLTATPIQNSIEELYNLIYLVRPGLLSTRKSFRAEFVQQRNRRVPRNVQRLRDLVGQVMVRSRRSEANIAFTERNVELIEVGLEGAEGDLYHSLDMFIRENYTHLPYFEKGLNRLTLMLLERMVTSSPQALQGTIFRLLEKGNLPPSFEEGLRRIHARAEALTVPAKFRAVKEVVGRNKEKVLVYTQFRDTQAALADYLEAAGHEVFRFHGGLPVRAKDTVVKDFAKSDHGVLISTDAGAEGRNLQFCRVLINFDLPWNPMKVEQRIGRVHRLGQTRDVDIVNLYYTGSIEEYVVRLLTEKIKLFTLVVGELDSILGFARTRNDIETEIMDVYMSSEQENELDDRFERLGRHYERAFRDYDGMKDAQNSIFEADT
jgi:SNF2 family DNA or RNA helicase